MSLLDVFRREKKENSAAIAKERLQILVTHERTSVETPDYLPAMEQDILAVVRKYVPVGQDNVTIHFENNDDISILEVEVTLPDQDSSKVHIA